MARSWQRSLEALIVGIVHQDKELIAGSSYQSWAWEVAVDEVD